jgi:hypothetical protein
MPAVPLGVGVIATLVAGIVVALGTAVAAAVGALVAVVAAVGGRRPATWVAMLLNAPAGDVALPVGAVVGAALGVFVAAAVDVGSFVLPPHAARIAAVVPAAMPPRKRRRLSTGFMMSLFRISRILYMAIDVATGYVTRRGNENRGVGFRTICATMARGRVVTGEYGVCWTSLFVMGR